jgi:hypothetical protein
MIEAIGSLISTLFLLNFQVFMMLLRQIIKSEQPTIVCGGSEPATECIAGTAIIPPPTPKTGAKKPMKSPASIRNINVTWNSSYNVIKDSIVMLAN